MIQVEQTGVSALQGWRYEAYQGYLMPPLLGVDLILAAVCTAKSTFDWICDHLDKLKEAKAIVKRIMEFIQYMQNELQKIEMYAKDDRYHEAGVCTTDRDSDKVRAETYVDDFLVHLQNIKSSLESSEAERNIKGAMNQVKRFLKIGTVVDKLLAIEDELKLAMDKLQLFTSVLTLKVTCESRDAASQNTHLLYEIRDEIKATHSAHNDVGIDYILDSATKRPSAPCDLTIQEGKNTFVLSWQPCCEQIDKYELCYHESENRACFIDKTKCNVEIGAPKVKPSSKNLPYTMKIRGVCGNIKGEWSNTVVGQFTKPLPQKPTIKKLFLRSTIAEITVTTPAAICVTESPVTRWQVAYIVDTGTEWSHEEFAVEADEIDQTFYIHNLEPKRRYTFKVKAMNAEGWSDFSYEISGSTNKLPQKTAKPMPPLVETLSRTTVKITVESPEGASYMTPVILWQVTAIYFDCSARKEIIKRVVFKPNYARECSSFNIVELTPKQQYNFKVMAKNERGWSQPSDIVIAFTGPPLPPTIRSSSFKSTSLIKVRWELPSKYTRPSYYEICKKTKGSKGKEIETQRNISGDKSSAIFTNLNENTTYYFKLRCWNGLYASEWTEEIQIKTDHIPIHKKLSPRPRSPSTPKSISDIETGYSSTLVVIDQLLTTKAAELSDQSDDEDPIIL